MLRLLVGGSTRPLLLGPDAAHQNSTAPHKPSPRDAYLYDFFDEAGRLGVPVHGATLHKYVYLLVGSARSQASIERLACKPSSANFQLIRSLLSDRLHGTPKNWF